jgi:hypothetical protein
MNGIFACVFACVGLIASGIAANAQSNPSPPFSYGSVPTAGQWNSYFAAKQDYLGFTPFSTAGGSLSGELSLHPSTTSISGLNVGIGVAPTSPLDGDLWMTTRGIAYRAGGVTYGPFGGGSSPTNTGSCAINTQVGGNIAGTFHANGACVAGTIILGFATTAPNGWACFATDRTTPADAVNQSASSATSATFGTVTMVASDVVQFSCAAY